MSRLTAGAALTALSALCGLALIGASGYLISAAALRPSVLDLLAVIVAVRALSLGKAVFGYGGQLAVHDGALRLLAGVRRRLYARIEPLAPAGLGPAYSGPMLSRLVGDIERTQQLLVRLLPAPLAALVAVATMTGVLWRLAPGAVPWLVAPAAIMGLALPWLAHRLARRPGAAVAGAREALRGGVVELVQHGRELLVTGAADAALGRMRATDADLQRASSRIAAGGAVAGMGALAAAGIGTAGVLLAGTAASSGGALPPLAIGALALGALATFEVVRTLPATLARLPEAASAVGRLRELDRRTPPVTPPSHPAPCLTGDIVLSGARLRYDGGPWILDGFDLRVGQGEHVALVGPSGSGKSSVAHVLLRFRDLDGGRATLAGRDLRELDPSAVRRVIGLAAQDAHVFTTTIRENIRLARPGATQRELDGVAHRARIREWIEGLPEGWDTMVGEGGSLVSAGQRQRIALARALLAGFPVLILDEPTANLDPPTARALIGDVLDMARGRTLLLITHRPEEAALMDRVVEMPAHG